jgi:hypothetical protein
MPAFIGGLWHFYGSGLRKSPTPTANTAAEAETYCASLGTGKPSNSEPTPAATALKNRRNQDEQTQQTVAALLRPMSAVSCCGIRPDPPPRGSTCPRPAGFRGLWAVEASWRVAEAPDRPLGYPGASWLAAALARSRGAAITIGAA